MSRSLTLLFFVCWLVIGPNASLSVCRADDSQTLNLIVKTVAGTDSTVTQLALLKGMLAGLEGRRNVPAPKGWAKLAESLRTSSNKQVRDIVMQLSQIFGDTKAIEKALAVIADSKATIGQRRTALRALLSQQNDQASALLEKLLDEPELQLDAIRGFAMVENAAGPAILLKRYKNSSPDCRRAIIETLATRRTYASALLEAITNKRVQKQDIPSHVARSLESLLGEQFTKVFGEVKMIQADRKALIAKYKKLITPAAMETASAARGRAIFKKTCASCHLMYGEGAKIGPDLTGSNRANLDYILLNSVDPSYDVPLGYRMTTIVTESGRVVNGVIAEEDDTRVVLKTVEQPRVVITKSDIDIRKLSKKSMMPDGQLDKMKPGEILDLIKYLRTTEQVELPQ